ncbi:YceI family protein [Alteromonadaceae bacterium M269]|nr:YceI family protein [Alteromonadaceae bacterium M269]
MRIVRLFTLLSVISFQALAGWQLSNDKSSVNFLTTKQEHITEKHSFKALSGKVNDSGQFSLDIDLSSVDTKIGIRDERMQKWLFETASFAKANISADVSEALKQSKKNSVSQATINAVLNLHGVKKDVAIDVLITNVDGKKLIVSSQGPVLISANDYKLVQGVAKLQELAGLKSIGLTVPVTFNLVFNK